MNKRFSALLLPLIPMIPVILLAGCEEKKPDPKPGPEPEPTIEQKIPLRISPLLTKVSGQAFDNGDAIGLYIVNQDNGSSATLQPNGNHADNTAFTFDGQNWNAPSQLYWKNNRTKADFYAYYPYKDNIQDIHAVPFNIPADQCQENDWKSGIVLWGKTGEVAPTENAVLVTTRHMTGELQIVLKPGTGWSEETFSEVEKSVRINSVRTGLTLDLADGSVAATGDPEDMIPFFDGDSWRAYVVPQAIEEATLVTIEVDGNVFHLTRAITFQSNVQQKCTITVNRVSEGVNVGIGEWETDENDYGGTV